MSADLGAANAVAAWTPPNPSKGIGYYLVKLAFPLVYAPTMTVFTASFFERIAPPPAADLSLFGLVPLVVAHRFALPLLVIALELLSIQLACGFWRLRGRSGAGLVAAVFLAMQMLPMVAIYVDARTQDFRQQKDAALQQTKVSAAALTAYQRQLDIWTARKKEIAGQIADTRSRIDFGYAQLQTANGHLHNPVTIAEREAARETAASITATIDGLERTDASLRQELVAVGANLPHEPVASAVDVPVLHQTDLDFIVATAGTWSSALAVFISTIFVAVVFAAGYVLATADGALVSALAANPVDLTAQLRLCSTLPEERQLIFAEQLAATMRYQLAALEALRRQAAGIAMLELEGGRQMDGLRLLSSFKDEVNAAGLSATTRERLQREIDALIATAAT